MGNFTFQICSGSQTCILISLAFLLSSSPCLWLHLYYQTLRNDTFDCSATCSLIKEAGFPAGVVNVVLGSGPECGKPLALHPDVDKVGFTGSSAVGYKIVKYSGESNLKKCTLEQGGTSPIIICDDADLKLAAGAAFIGLFLNHGHGQCCCASSRIFVDSKILISLLQ